MSYIEFLRYAHSVDGELRLEHDGRNVRLSCRWPADLSTDEWIVLGNQFDLAAYNDAVQALVQQGKGVVPGVRHGNLEMNLKGGGRVEIDVSDARGQAPPRLIMELDLAPEAFRVPRNADGL